MNISNDALRGEGNDMNWSEALAHFQLDFEMETFPLGFLNEHGTYQTLKGVNGMRRADTLEPLSGVSVGERYKIVQNSAYADIGDRICSQAGAKFTAGGLFKGGRISYLTAKLPDIIRVKGTDDVIDQYITFINSFDGSTAFMILPTALRLFCDNQLPAVKRTARSSGLVIRHTASSEQRVKEADRAYLDVVNAYRAFEVKCNWLAEQKFTDAQMNLAARQLFDVQPETSEDEIHGRKLKSINTIKDLFVSGRGIAQWRGTAWAAYSALTEFSDHHRSLRSTTDEEESKLLGSGALFKSRAMDVIESVLAA